MEAQGSLEARAESFGVADVKFCSPKLTASGVVTAMESVFGSGIFDRSQELNAKLEASGEKFIIE
jgi:hypothetical protein